MERTTGWWSPEIQLRLTCPEPVISAVHHSDSHNDIRDLESANELRSCDIYVENNDWQIGEIQAALKEADAGEFASDKNVSALAKKWKVNAI